MVKRNWIPTASVLLENFVIMRIYFVKVKSHCGFHGWPIIKHNIRKLDQ